jgi:hypothetical protein
MVAGLPMGVRKHLEAHACNQLMILVQEVGTALVDACVGCPLSLILAVGAIRQAAQALPDADLMAAKYLDCWHAIRLDLKKELQLAQALGSDLAEYERAVRGVYASSIFAVRHRFEGGGSTIPGATAKTLDLLLQALRLLSPGRWVPAAAVIAIWLSLAEACPDDCGDAETADAALQLLAAYSIIMTETKSVYKRNGVHSLLLRIHCIHCRCWSPSQADCCVPLCCKTPSYAASCPSAQH